MDTIDQIVETGYFGDATAEDILAICEEATRHRRGYLLLPMGSAPALPLEQWHHIGVDADIDVPHLSIAADYMHASSAALALLNALTNPDRYAVVGTDGVRDVVWAVGTSVEEAWEEASLLWLSDDAQSRPKLRLERITQAQYELVLSCQCEWNIVKGIAS